MAKHRMICRTCGGSNVKRDAWAEWDEHAQAWVCGDVYDNAYCDDCDGETSIDTVEIVALTIPKTLAGVISRAIHEAAACRDEEATDGGHDAEQTAMNEDTAEEYAKAAETFDALTAT